MDSTRPERRDEVLEKTRDRTEQPRQFRVVLHNDDYTTMDFVVEVLETVFDKSPAESYRIMMQIHSQGRGTAGVYPHEIAETKAALVEEHAREAGHPLRATVEED